MSFLTPTALFTLALAIPIVLLYMLRLRRREVTVSSTFLWQQVLRDREANTPWQRLRRNLLLFLQLIILALLALALARPYILVPAVSTGQIAVLIDASASMNAADSPDGTRFDEAKRLAREIIDTMNSGDRMTILRVGDTVEVLAPYTDDRALLHTALDSAQPGRASADWNTALTLAAAGAQAASDFNVVLISDGGGELRAGDRARLPTIPGDLQYVKVGRSAENVGIAALATRALPGERPQLFAQITNYGTLDAEVIFDLRVDGELFVAERVRIPAGESQPFISSVLPEGFSTLQAGLTRPISATTPDYLADDNSAYAVAAVNPARRALLITSGNLFLEQVLRTLPDLNVFAGDPRFGVPRQAFDLYIFDGYLPPVLPDGDLLLINPPENTSLFTIGDVLSIETNPLALQNPRVRRDDPRLTFVDVSALNLRAFRQITAPWATPAIEVDGGPLLLLGEQDGREIAIFTFDLRDSDLPLQIAFPILMASLIDWFTPQQIVNAPEDLRVGGSITLTLPPEATAARITLPDGATRIFPNDRPQMIFAETEQAGLYRVDVLTGEAVIESASFAVNVFSPDESAITPQESIIVGDAVVTQAVEEEIGQREFWPLLALLALLVLLIEWFIYHRRLRAPTRFRPLTQRTS